MEHLDHKKKIMIVLAIMSAMLFAALNQTIVGTALPKIISELGGMEYYSWVFTIYMLTSSVTSVLVGKLSDLYGRKPFILVGIGIFIVGSFLSGLSNTIIQLITYRGLQGFGAGMVMSTSFTAIGDLFSPRERGRWQGIMTSVFGLASVFGPTLGGWIVDNSDWHWVFWVFLPVGILAFFMILFLFPKTPKNEKEPIDYFGSLMLSLTIIPLLMAFTWGGSQYAWSSIPIITLLVGAVVALGLFIFIEQKAKSPVLPLQLFKNKVFMLSNIISFIIGFGMFGTAMYMPFFIQGILGMSAAVSGLMIMPMSVSMVITSAISGQLITKTGTYKKNAIIGLFIMGLGLFLLSLMNEQTSTFIAIINIIVVGAGLGLSMSVFTLTVQNTVPHSLLGVATASSQLFRQMGGTVGVGLLGTIMNNGLKSNMEETAVPLVSQHGDHGFALLEKLENPQLLISSEQLQRVKNSLSVSHYEIFDSLVPLLKTAMSNALTSVFLFSCILVTIGFTLTFFLKEEPLRETQHEPPSEKRKIS